MKHCIVITSLVLLFVLIGCQSKPSSTTSDNNTAVNNYLTRDKNVYILWKDPSQYSDVESTDWVQSKFEKYLFTDLTDELGQLANQYLKENQQLDLMVTNLDLAGDVQPTFGAGPGDVRVFSDLYPPKIKFDYVLKQNGQIIKQGSEDINDMSYLFGIQPVGNDDFPYQRRILRKWFKETIQPVLTQG